MKPFIKNKRKRKKETKKEKQLLLLVVFLETFIIHSKQSIRLNMNEFHGRKKE